ncbi:MAG: CDP-glycerol glycerophosphotransferase family protein [Chlamydiia bacterium]|nr:CDP-glycerol glycerophosphotransferase family protein [Chlamydiia bacterium]MCP5509468.1 CDP-glycerol glycerophosphotransferase family protein [Chlamydiales bacterium]
MKAAAITNSFTHPDHLAPLCHILGMPLVITDPALFELSAKHYPQIEMVYCDHRDFGPSFLKNNFDTLFISGKRWTTELAHLLRGAMRFIYCPHGNSDKTFGFKHIDPHLLHDIHLVYGPQMLGYLKEHHLLEKIQKTVLVGNYRYSFYKQFQTHFDLLAEQNIFSQFEKDQPTILYAPTWKDLEDSTSFLDHCQTMIGTLPPHLNLLVKLHPLLERHQPAHTYYIIEHCKKYPNIQVLLNYPVIYPILNRCAIYLGDYSSVGYDALTFNKPMFFLHKPGYETPLSTCGTTVEGNPFEVIETPLSSEHKNAQIRLYNEAFGPEQSPKAIHSDILAALKETHPLVIA